MILSPLPSRRLCVPEEFPIERGNDTVDGGEEMANWSWSTVEEEQQDDEGEGVEMRLLPSFTPIDTIGSRFVII